MSENIMFVPSRLKSSVVGGYVTGADQIVDDATGKSQAEINGGIEAATERLDARINEVVEGIQEQMDTIMETATGQLNEAISGAKEELNTAVEGLQSDVNSAIEQVNQVVSTADEKIAQVETIVESAVSEATSQLDERITSAVEQVNGIVEGAVTDFIPESKKNVTLSLTPVVTFKGREISVAVDVLCEVSADSITVFRGSAEILSGNGLSLSGTDTVTPADNVVYQVRVVYGAATVTKTQILMAVSPVLYGAGSVYTDAMTEAPAELFADGSYTFNVETAGSYIFFNIPASMASIHATMGNVEFPLDTPVAVTINGVAYNSYRSSNTYGVGEVTIVLS